MPDILLLSRSLVLIRNAGYFIRAAQHVDGRTECAMVQLALCVGRLVGLASEIVLYQVSSQLNLRSSLSQTFFLLHDENRAR